MPRIEQKTETTNTEPKPEITIDNRLEMVRHVAEVQSRIKDRITSDYTYAKLNDKDKKYCLEMFKSASLGMVLLERIALKTQKTWYWNNTEQQWEHKNRPEKEQKIIKSYATQIFEAYMRQIDMLVNLNRNNKENSLLRWTLQVPEEQEQQETQEETPTLKDKFKKIIKPREKEEE